MLQMNRDAIEIVGPERAMRASRVPFRIEHEVIYDQLARAVEELRQSFLALRSFERVLLIDALPRQLAPFRAKLVAEPVKLLLFGHQFFPLFKPFCMRYDFVIWVHNGFLPIIGYHLDSSPSRSRVPQRWCRSFARPSAIHRSCS